MPAAKGKNTSGQKGKKTAAKKTPSSSGRTKRRPDKRTIAKKKEFLSGEVKVILAALLGLFLFLSNFGVMGSVGDFFSSVQKGLFGMTGYAFPVLLLLSVVLYVKNQGSFLAGAKTLCCMLVLLILSGLMQLLFGGEELLSAGAYYEAGAAGELSGGLVGGVLAGTLRQMTGTVGAYLILIAFLIICAVFITEKSFVGAARAGAERTAKVAREGHERAREAAAEHRQYREARKEEARLLREERRTRGIDFDSLNLDEESREAYAAREAQIYAGYGRELIEGQPGIDDVDDGTGHGPLRKTRYLGTADPEDGRYDTQILPQEESFTGEIEGLPDYDDDSVPFEETEEDPYRSYHFGTEHKNAHGNFDLEAAERRGYAAGAGAETLPKAEPAGLNAFLSPEPAEASENLPEDLFGPASEDHPEETEAVREDLGNSFGEFRKPEGRTVTATGKELAATTDEARELLKKKLAGEVERIDTGEEQKKAAAPTEAENKAVAAEIKKKTVVKKPYVFPPLNLLKKGPRLSGANQQELRDTAAKLQQVLRTFGVGVTVTHVARGPSVTRYELTPDAGVKVSRITALTDDIKLALAAADIRIEAPIPGKAAVGIEVPNKDNATVYFRDIIDTEEFRNHKSRLAFAIGKDIAGKPVVGDIAKMPHLLIAGATGSGKSVGINTLIMSLIYKSSPEDVRMIMIDPKVVELSVYNGIPHLLIPVVTDPKKAASALNWAVAEMTDRYKKFAETGARDLKGYNAKAEEVQKQLPDEEEEKLPKKLPQIVIIIDELADLMMVAPGEVEDAIIRLTQLARAAGIHLVIATQRPSVNVITGLIKANVPSRIAFKTASGTDSRTILDMNGAEKLLGSGDMLYFPSGAPKPNRVQGSFISDGEVQAVVDFLTKHGEAEYSQEIGSAIENDAGAQQPGGGGGTDSSRDEYFAEAGKLIIEKDKASIGMLQRMFKIGFNRAARIMDQLAEAGVVGPEEGTKPRKILMTEAEFEAFLSEK